MLLTLDEARARAAEGAALLDAQLPGWHTQIDLDLLDIADCDRCVLGQLYGQYIIGCRRLKLQQRGTVERLGFFTEIPRFTTLKVAWAEVICDRLAADTRAFRAYDSCEAGSALTGT